jgi:hypothetical protein
MAAITSPGSSTVSMCGVSPGSRCNSISGTVRCPFVPPHLDGCVDRDQRHREIGRVGGDAVLAGAEYRMPAILAANG